MKYPKDERLEKVEEITIDWETFKKALKRNYLESNNYHDRSFVLRLYPPFENEMKAEYYESMQGTRYDNNWSEKPYHITPELILLEGTDEQPFRWTEWPTETNVKNNMPESDIEDIGGIDEALTEAREWFWDEMKTFLPDTYELGLSNAVPSNKKVELNWVGLDDE